MAEVAPGCAEDEDVPGAVCCQDGGLDDMVALEELARPNLGCYRGCGARWRAIRRRHCTLRVDARQVARK